MAFTPTSSVAVPAKGPDARKRVRKTRGGGGWGIQGDSAWLVSGRGYVPKGIAGTDERAAWGGALW